MLVKLFPDEVGDIVVVDTALFMFEHQFDLIIDIGIEKILKRFKIRFCHLLSRKWK